MVAVIGEVFILRGSDSISNEAVCKGCVRTLARNKKRQRSKKQKRRRGIGSFGGVGKRTGRCARARARYSHRTKHAKRIARVHHIKGGNVLIRFSAFCKPQEKASTRNEDDDDETMTTTTTVVDVVFARATCQKPVPGDARLIPAVPRLCSAERTGWVS